MSIETRIGRLMKNRDSKYLTGLSLWGGTPLKLNKQKLGRMFLGAILSAYDYFCFLDFKT
jgi:hypothetical protein